MHTLTCSWNHFICSGTPLIRTPCFVLCLLQLSDPPLEVSSLYPSALCLYGSWLAHTHSENPGTIMKSYFEQSVSLMVRSSGCEFVRPSTTIKGNLYGLKIETTIKGIFA